MSKPPCTLKQRLLKIHLCLVIFVLVNFVLSLWAGVAFHSSVVFAAKMIIYATGVILFFMTMRPFKWLSFYFSLYVVSPLLVVVSWLLNGLLGAILGSLFLFMFYPPQPKFQDGNFVFMQKFQGFLGSCCTYTIVQNKFFIFQKCVGEIRLDGSDAFKNSTFTASGKTGYLKVNIEVYDGVNKPSRKVDTTLEVLLK